MHFLFALAFPVLSLAAADWIAIPARQASGFYLENDSPHPVASCIYERNAEDGKVSLYLRSDPFGGVELGFLDFLPLPLREGQWPTHQEGTTVIYEEGVLEIRREHGNGLSSERLALRLEIDPWLANPRLASGRSWIRDGFLGREREIQRLDCVF